MFIMCKEGLRITKVKQDLGIADENYFAGESHHYDLDTSAVHMVR